MPTRQSTVSDLQEQIDNLLRIVEDQNVRAERTNELLQALQAAAPAQPTAPAPSVQLAPAFPKIPDLIRMVPEFSGNPRDLPRWIDSVEEKLTESKKFMPPQDIPQILPIWTGIIRDKIKEKASDALSASHTPLEWDSIKNTLIEYFGDKSSLSTLVSKMTTLKQGGQTVTEFYQTTKSLLAEINAKILITNNTPNEAKAIMGTYETLIVNAFVDGLHDATSDLTRSTRPKSLADAYLVASEHEAAIHRRREKIIKQPMNVFKTIKAPVATHNRQPTYVPPAQPRPFFPHNQRLARPFVPNQGLAIKQEPKSHTGLRPPFRPGHINVHEQYIDEEGQPPTSSQYNLAYEEEAEYEPGQSYNFQQEELANHEHDANFSPDLERNPPT